MPTITIDYKNYLRGESYADYAPNAGFSPDSRGLNLTKAPGVLYFVEVATATSGSTISSAIIAAVEDVGGDEGYFIADDGTFYMLVGSTISDQSANNANGVYTYAEGFTDIVTYKGNYYFTSKTSVGTFDNNMGTITPDWWTNGGADFSSVRPHSLEVLQGELFIGGGGTSGNVIYFYDGANSGTAFTLPSSQQITSLRKHPDGKTLLAFTSSQLDASHTNNNPGKVYYCNPNIRDWEREVQLDTQVEGTKLLGGVVYAAWGKTIGYFTGDGLEPLKKLATSTYSWNNAISSFEDNLLIRDGRLLKAYGNIGAGKAWWNVHRESANISTPFYKGDNVLIWSDVNGVMKEIDLDNGGANGLFYSNRYIFDRQVKVRRIDIITETTTSYDCTLSYRDQADTSNTIQQFSNQTGTNIFRIQADITTDIFQLALTPQDGAIGIRAIRIHYDAIE